MNAGSDRVLILAPFGRDSLLLQEVLERGHIEATICAGFDGFCQEMKEEFGALLVADEILGAPEIAELRSLLAQQPEWSDVILLVMTSGGSVTRASQHRLKLIEPLEATITLLERPLRAATLLSVTRAALRARRRQYQVRDLLVKEKRNAHALQTANQSLSESNERLSEFAYIASHDLREPLRTISAYTQLLDRRYKKQFDEDAQQYIEFVIQGASRMQQLIEDLLSYSRVTAVESPAQAVTDGQSALVTVQEDLRTLLQETNAEISSSPLPVVAVHFRHLVQLFENLIANALKYRKADAPPRIHLAAVRQNSFWLFEVADNGMGFDQKYAEQIFRIFKRLQRDDDGGTGIGLAICKRIVEHYGGRIWATSSPGIGSTFSFLLPGVEH